MTNRNSPRYLLFLAIVLFLPELKACSAGNLSEGERLYNIHCAGCHGAKGEGSRGPILAVPKLARVDTEEALSNLVRQGIPGTEMLQANLDQKQARLVAAWVRKLGQMPMRQSAGDPQHGERL